MLRINAFRGERWARATLAICGGLVLSACGSQTLWRSSSTGTVGRLAVAGQVPSVAVRDPDEAYGQMVRDMVRDVTRDLRPTWVKQ